MIVIVDSWSKSRLLYCYDVCICSCNLSVSNSVSFSTANQTLLITSEILDKLLVISDNILQFPITPASSDGWLAGRGPGVVQLQPGHRLEQRRAWPGGGRKLSILIFSDLQSEAKLKRNSLLKPTCTPFCLLPLSLHAHSQSQMFRIKMLSLTIGQTQGTNLN